MPRRYKPRKRDMQYVPFDRDELWLRAFALVTDYGAVFPTPPGGWARQVKKRDNRTCRACGQTEGHMHAHHTFRLNGLVPVVGIGVTLCEECHHAMHHMGRRGYKPEFLRPFINEDFEITPYQFDQATKDETLVNKNLTRDDFWWYRTNQECRVRLAIYGLREAEPEDVEFVRGKGGDGIWSMVLQILWAGASTQWPDHGLRIAQEYWDEYSERMRRIKEAEPGWFASDEDRSLGPNWPATFSPQFT